MSTKTRTSKTTSAAKTSTSPKASAKTKSASLTAISASEVESSRAAATSAVASTASPTTSSAPTKLTRVIALLQQPAGASLPDLMAATGWQAHSVRGALAGAVKRKGHAVTSQKADGERRYRIEAAQ